MNITGENEEKERLLRQRREIQLALDALDARLEQYSDSKLAWPGRLIKQSDVSA